MNNPYLKRISKRGSTGHGNISEKRIANSVGARQTPKSGALQGAKADMDKMAGKQKFKIEAKSTVSDSLKIDLGWLVKVATEAAQSNAVPALAISFVTPEGKSRPNGDWVALPSYIVKEFFAFVEGSE